MLWASIHATYVSPIRQLESNVVSIYSRKYVESPIRQLESNVVSIYSRKYVAHPSGS